jgi:hypothetical protein
MKSDERKEGAFGIRINTDALDRIPEGVLEVGTFVDVDTITAGLTIVVRLSPPLQ